MPIIKDKYGAKGSQTRSKFLTRSKNKAISDSVPEGLSTQQKQELAKESYRANAANRSQISNLSSSDVLPIETKPQSFISRFSISLANQADLIFTLNAGSTLNDIIIHNYNAGGTASTINLYWTTGDQDGAAFTVSSGVITASKPMTLTNLFGDSFSYNGTVSLGDMVNRSFKNVSKDIHFYCTSSVAGPNITISSTDG
tara:strand:- start:805 stop:1401 length:597 start_codon:yes stop_codon:yes gene_type:complete